LTGVLYALKFLSFIDPTYMCIQKCKNFSIIHIFFFFQT
jgi:hypothetical protein